jgi:putative transposase
MMSYSVDLRQRVIDYVNNGGSQVSASTLFKVGRKTIYNWLHRENLSPTPRLIRSRKIDKSRLLANVHEQPEALLHERALEFGVTPSGVWRALRTLKISKKND